MDLEVKVCKRVKSLGQNRGVTRAMLILKAPGENLLPCLLSTFLGLWPLLPPSNPAAQHLLFRFLTVTASFASLFHS